MDKARAIFFYASVFAIVIVLPALCGYFLALLPILVISAVLAILLAFFYGVGKHEGTPGVAILLIALLLMLCAMWVSAIIARWGEISDMVGFIPFGEWWEYAKEVLFRK